MNFHLFPRYNLTLAHGVYMGLLKRSKKVKLESYQRRWDVQESALDAESKFFVKFVFGGIALLVLAGFFVKWLLGA